VGIEEYLMMVIVGLISALGLGRLFALALHTKIGNIKKSGISSRVIMANTILNLP